MRDLSDLVEYQDWLNRQTNEPLSELEKVEFWQLTRQFGPTGCWTGTNGTLARAIVRLLVEVERLESRLRDELKLGPEYRDE